MIGSLTGKITYKNQHTLLIDVHGVGYKVYATASLFDKPLGTELTVFTHTHVREDLLELYAFVSQQDLSLFEKLIDISGIGPKTALGIFSLGETAEIVGAIRKADVDFFTGVPRLGKKNAQKIIIELRNKIGAEAELDIAGETDGVSTEVVSALTSIGFSEKESWEAIRSLKGQGQTVEEKVKLALRSLGKK